MGRSGAVWPTGFDWFATATAGAARDMAFSSSGMAAASSEIQLIVYMYC